MYWPSKLLNAKVIISTRDMTAASGNVAYTGVGFQPRAIIALAMINLTKMACWGIGDSSLEERCFYYWETGLDQYSYDAALVRIQPGAGVAQAAVIASMGSDGFTLTWTKTGVPGANTLQLMFLCLA